AGAEPAPSEQLGLAGRVPVRQGGGQAEPLRRPTRVPVHRDELPPDRARALRHPARATPRSAAAEAIRRDPGGAREREEHQERRQGAGVVEAGQGRGAGPGHEAPRADDRGRPEGLPDRHPDPLGLRRRLGGQRSLTRPLLAGQRADTVRRRRQRANAGVQGLPRQPGEDLMLQVLTEVWEARRARTEILEQRHPFAAEVMRLYAALLPVQDEAFLDARTTPPAPGRIAAHVAERVVPRIAEVTAAAGPNRLAEEVPDCLDRSSAQAIVAGWMVGDEQGPAERYLARAALSPGLEAM